MPGSLRVHKKVISHDTGNALLCCYRDCEDYGYELYKVRINYGAPGYPHIVQYVFCSETHKMYFVRAGSQINPDSNNRYNDGYLASGDRRRY